MAEHRKRKVNDEMSECTSCGEYFGTSEECPLCGASTIAISKGIEAFEDFKEEVEEGLSFSPKLAYGEATSNSEFNPESEEYLAEAI